MAVGPINVTRLSSNLRADFVIQALRQNQLAVFNEQARIATGRQFASAGDDPVAASRAVDLSQALTRSDQFLTNLRHADNTLAAADSAMTEVNSLLIEAQTIASDNVSNLTSRAERESVADLIAGIRRQLQDVGNREFNGRFLFAGRNTTQRPFVDALGGIAYIGDTGDITVRVGEDADASINVPGNILFDALSARIASDADLTPNLTENTRLDELGGATGAGIRTGTLVFNEQGGAGVFRVDLASADTIGDIVQRINDAATQAGASVTASLGDEGLVLTPGNSPVSVTDTSTGLVAAQLGILTPTPSSTEITGAALGVRITPLTSVADLARGAGIDLDSGLVITNGLKTVTVDLSQAETVQDILNRINNAGVFVLARINESGTAIDIFNQVSGTTLSVGENDGTTAADLGLRTFNAATTLDSLNFGEGVTRIEGQDDFRITARDGSTIDVNLDGADTIGDVIQRINDAAQAAGVNITAELTTVGNGIALQDATGGTGDLQVSLLNQSAAALDLGILGTVTGPDPTLVGEDRALVRTEGALGALVELENALRGDDTTGITRAAQRLERFSKEVTRVHGIVGARSQAMRDRFTQMEDAASATKVFLSEVQDLDYAEAITKLQSAGTQLQASLSTSSLLLNVSLLDYLG